MASYFFIIVFCGTTLFLTLVYLNGNVFATKINNKLKNKNDGLTKKISPLKKQNKKVKKETIKTNKSNQVQNQLKLSDQLAEAKQKCWNVEIKKNKKAINLSHPLRESFTWMVAIFQKKPKLPFFSKLICGGCLISSRFVLTVGRHFFNASRYWLTTENKWLSVHYGMRDLYSKNFKEAEVEEIYIHPEYLFPDGYYSDIALVKLKKSIKYGQFVNPICIPKLTTPDNWESVRVNNLVIFSHWKHIDPNIKLEPNAKVHLQKGIGVIKEPSVCKQTYIHKFRYNTSTTICIEDYQIASKLCEGDEGSPVSPVSTASELTNTEYPVVIGVVSAGGKRCSEQHVLTKVELYIDWINNITKI